MSSVYSTSFIQWAADETPPAFVVPDGYVAVVRDLDVVWGGGAMVNWQMGIATGAKIAGGQFTEETLIQHQEWRGRQVLNAGQALYVSADGPIDGAVSGYLLGIAS